MSGVQIKLMLPILCRFVPINSILAQRLAIGSTPLNLIHSDPFLQI